MKKISAPYKYIDTLYLAWRFDIPTTDRLETKFFVRYGADYIGTSNGYNWFNCPVGRFGIVADVENIHKANAYSFILQYNNEYLLKNFINSFEDLPNRIDTLHLPGAVAKVKRVDFSLITNDTRILREDIDVITKFRTKTVISKKDVVETVYLGKRANGKVFRYYRKDIELKKDKNIVKEDYFRFYFSDIDFDKPVMVAELEMHRSHLMPKYGINDLRDWERLLDLYRQNFSEIKFYEVNEDNKKHIESRNYDYVDTIVFDFSIKKKLTQEREQYRPSLTFLFSRVDKMVQKYIDRTGLKVSKTELLLNATKGYLPLVALKELDYFEIKELLEEQDLYLLDLDGKISSKIELKPTKPIEEFTLEELNVGGKAGIVQNPRDLF